MVIMDITACIKQYFNNTSDITIDVFDSSTIYTVFQRVIVFLTKHIGIETSVLQALSYCFYEILDNVLTHSGKIVGTVITNYDANKHALSILVVDDGMGIQRSLSADPKYNNITESEAIRVCIEDSVTDGKGMGFGLYSTSLLAQSIAIRFEIHSGTHQLLFQNGAIKVEQVPMWQGTKVFLALRTNQEIDPNEIVAHRTDCITQYNEIFLNTPDLEELW